MFADMTEYEPAFRIPCYTDAQNGLARLGAPASGIIVELPIVEGARVRKGDLLAVLDTDKFREGGDSELSALRERIRAEHDMIDREIVAARGEAAANHEMVRRRIAGLRVEADAAKTESRSADRLVASFREQADQYATLVGQGYVSRLQLAQKRDELTLQVSRAASVRAAVGRIDRDIATSEAEERIIDARLSEAVEGRRRELAELERVSVQSDSNARQVVRAPADGVVSTVLIVKGQSVVTGQMLFSLIPPNEFLVARLLVPARASASIEVGLNIRFALQAYPREKFGNFPARIVSIGTTAVLPGDLIQVLPISGGTFIAVAALPSRLYDLDGHRLWLKPGMIGEAIVPLERRKILEWLLDPILRGLNRDPEALPMTAIQG
jgi:membrane fusion protein